jgi:hypothetical protein
MYRKLFGYIGSVDKEFVAPVFAFAFFWKTKYFFMIQLFPIIHSVPMKIKVMGKEQFRVMISCRCKNIIKMMGKYRFIEIFIFVLLNKLNFLFSHSN